MNPPGGGRGSHRAALLALLCVVAGLTLSILLISSEPLGHDDLDDDGISDMFQDIHPIVTYRLGEDGQWKEELVGHGSRNDLPMIAFTAFASVLAFPLAVYLLLSRKEPVDARRLERSEMTSMHDSVRRIASFLEVNPSLISAVKQTYASLPDDRRGPLGDLIWSARAKGGDFSKEYERFRAGWDGRDPVVGRALGDLQMAEREPTVMEVAMSARRAMDDLTEAVRLEMSRYVGSLQGPTTALFAIGVLLPVLLATMIPLAGLGRSSMVMIGAFLWVGVPLSIVHFGGRIIDRRPMYKGVRASHARRPRPGVTALEAAGGAAGCLLSIVSASHLATSLDLPLALPGLGSDDTALIMLMWGIALLGSSLLHALSRASIAQEIRSKEIGRRIPPLLQSLAAGVSDGLSFEGALKRTLAADGSFLAGAVAVFPGMTTDPEVRDPELDNVLKAARHFSRAGSEAGGRALRALANHHRNVITLEEELVQRIDSSVGQMEVTASLFAPLMIGASVGIFDLLEPDRLSEGLSLLGGGASTMGTTPFILISGVYLMLLSASSSMTISRLRSGRASGGWAKVPFNLVRAMASFTAGIVLSSMIIG